MLKILGFADDLTGALEAGAKFAGRGLRTVVTAKAGACAGYEATVVDTETRHLGRAEAEAVVEAMAGGDADAVYKKTDSTLRGHIGAELRVLARVYGASVAYIPAYPAMGRTVRGGQLHLDGVPVHLTAFARDGLNPVESSSIADIVGGGFECVVYEGETDEEVAGAVQDALGERGCRIVAGPASVAEEIAARFGGARRKAADWPTIRRCVVVNGSRHGASARQVEFARARETAMAEWRIVEGEARGGDGPLEVAARTGEAVVKLVAAERADAVMAIGGDTAYGVWKALGCGALEPLGEAVAGVAVSRVMGTGLYLVTKAGGFGDEDVIFRVRRLLSGTDGE